MSESSSDKPKIIVDEDWKSQVQAEKEAIKDDQEGTAPTDSSDSSEQQAPPLPEASFSVLVTTLASQAVAALGQTAEPKDGKVAVNLGFAKHCIDTLDVLEQKTKGNLTSEESQLLSQFRHELRMMFVAVKTHLEKNPIPDGPKPDDPNPDSPIVTP